MTLSPQRLVMLRAVTTSAPEASALPAVAVAQPTGPICWLRCWRKRCQRAQAALVAGAAGADRLAGGPFQCQALDQPVELVPFGGLARSRCPFDQASSSPAPLSKAAHDAAVEPQHGTRQVGEEAAVMAHQHVGAAPLRRRTPATRWSAGRDGWSARRAASRRARRSTRGPAPRAVPRRRLGVVGSRPLSSFMSSRWRRRDSRPAPANR